MVLLVNMIIVLIFCKFKLKEDNLKFKKYEYVEEEISYFNLDLINVEFFGNVDFNL